MKNRTSSRTGLILMELIIAILFFSLAGVLCIQMFVKSHLLSKGSVELNNSILWAQNVAEAFYGCDGDANAMAALFDPSLCVETESHHHNLSLFFDKDFNLTEQDFSVSSIQYDYRLSADILTQKELYTCTVTVCTADSNEPIYELKLSLFPDKEVQYEP